MASRQLVNIFAKAEASPNGTVRGFRHIMLEDTDISSTRHARAAVGGLIAGLSGTGAVYVSGGAEHQGPPGGGPVAAIARLRIGLLLAVRSGQFRFMAASERKQRRTVTWCRTFCLRHRPSRARYSRDRSASRRSQQSRSGCPDIQSEMIDSFGRREQADEANILGASRFEQARPRQRLNFLSQASDPSG